MTPRRVTTVIYREVEIDVSLLWDGANFYIDDATSEGKHIELRPSEEEQAVREATEDWREDACEPEDRVGSER